MRSRLVCLALGSACLFGCSSASPRRGGEDASSAEAGSPGDGGEADAVVIGCQPGDVSAFRPPTYVGARAASSACAGFGGEGGLVATYGDSCVGREASYVSCTTAAAAAVEAGAPCYECLVTPEDAAAYSPVVVLATLPLVNYAGCIEAMDPTDAGLACATAIFAAATCAQYACRAHCSVVDGVSYEAYMRCLVIASESPCVGYSLSAEACIAAEQGDGTTPVATTCFGAGTDDAGTEEDHFLAAAARFCGAN